MSAVCICFFMALLSGAFEGINEQGKRYKFEAQTFEIRQIEGRTKRNTGLRLRNPGYATKVKEAMSCTRFPFDGLVYLRAMRS